jgi:hypothetical protein
LGEPLSGVPDTPAAVASATVSGGRDLVFACLQPCLDFRLVGLRLDQFRFGTGGLRFGRRRFVLLHGEVALARLQFLFARRPGAVRGFAR